VIVFPKKKSSLPYLNDFFHLVFFKFNFVTRMAHLVSDSDPRIIELEFKGDFTPKELETYRETFIKYDKNNSKSLEIFELNVMYEEW
jgi:hypothetical protein